MHKVYLKPGKEDSLKRFHPWIFSGAIAHFDGEPEEGEVVEVYTSKKEFIAKGHFQIGSIAVRVLSFKQEEINHDFWKHKLEVPPLNAGSRKKFWRKTKACGNRWHPCKQTTPVFLSMKRKTPNFPHC